VQFHTRSTFLPLVRLTECRSLRQRSFASRKSNVITLGREHAQLKSSGELVRGTNILSAHEPTVAVHDWSTGRVAINGVIKDTAISKGQIVIAA